MRVRAKELGFDNVALRQPGEEFDLPDRVYVLDPKSGKREKDADGKDRMVDFVIPSNAWFELVDEDDAPAKAKKRG